LPPARDLNAQLIRDEGHRNPMTMQQLADRMSGFLRSDYRAAIFAESNQTAGYALFRRELEHIYLRQFFVCPHLRRRGIGKAALKWLWESAWSDATRVRIDVLVDNSPGTGFWKAVGFREYCLTMEAERGD
jgi:GNAT superfamily N-acetyltransferase